MHFASKKKPKKHQPTEQIIYKYINKESCESRLKGAGQNMTKDITSCVLIFSHWRQTLHNHAKMHKSCIRQSIYQTNKSIYYLWKTIMWTKAKCEHNIKTDRHFRVACYQICCTRIQPTKRGNTPPTVSLCWREIITGKGYTWTYSCGYLRKNDVYCTQAKWRKVHLQLWPILPSEKQIFNFIPKVPNTQSMQETFQTN